MIGQFFAKKRGAARPNENDGFLLREQILAVDFSPVNLGSINLFPGAVRSFVATLFIFSFVQTVAHAMVINITYDSSITGLGNAAQVESAINTAAQAFEALYTNNITVNITASFSSSVGLGESQSFETGNPQ